MLRMVLAAVCGAVCLTAVAQGDPARAFDAATAAQRAPGVKVRIDLIGDSTQTNNAGYGRGFCANFTKEVSCVNMSKGGASTKTFREQGLWDRALATRPDYMVIQFGHNDNVTKEYLPRQVPLPDYIENLKRFVSEARAAGITPVLCTPLTRRSFDGATLRHDFVPYAEAMRGVAKEMNVPLVELNLESAAVVQKMGDEEARKFGITKKDPATGKTVPDQTHLNWAGSYLFGRMVAVDLGKAVPSLNKYVIPKAAVLPPDGEKAMRVIEGGPVKIVLVGDSTVATQGGWGPGFCAVMTPNVTCVDLALNGRSTKSFRDEDAWKKALAEKGDYYLIQFGHNDQKPDAARHTDPETTYAEQIRSYIRETRAIGAVPVVLSPLARRTFKEGKPSNEDLRLYANAARRVAMEEDVTFIDLLSLSTAVLAKGTQADADTFNAVGHEDARAEQGKNSVDRTHLNDKGKKVFGRIVADNLIRTQVELGPDVVGEPLSAAAPAQATPTDGK